jgi:uncharacterized metal-binding protein YceD (DUF177 family)
MSEPELSRIIRAHPHPHSTLTLTADESERRALADRFGIVAIGSLSAELALASDADAITAKGRLTADVMQNCAVSGEDFPTRIDETLDLRFVPAGALETNGEEVEFDSSQADEIEFAGDSFDLGEAVAQSLGLAIDPYAEGPGADEARRAAGLVDEDTPQGPLAEALARLTKN